MDKKEFVQRYVLNDPYGWGNVGDCLRDAFHAWDMIEAKFTEKPTTDLWNYNDRNG